MKIEFGKTYVDKAGNEFLAVDPKTTFAFVGTDAEGFVMLDTNLGGMVYYSDMAFADKFEENK